MGRAADKQRRASAKVTQPAWLVPLLGLSLLAAGLFAGYQYVTQPGRLPLRVIEVSGEFQQLEPDAIQRTVVGAIDGGFFTCDMSKLRTAVLAMPWVEDVSIRRSWPDRLDMRVTEQVPLARWGRDALISVAADVFQPASLAAFSGLVKLSGPTGSEQRVVAFFQGAVAPARARGLQISEVELDERRHWWLRFADGLTVSLGRDEVQERLAQFFRVYPSLMSQADRRPQRVDMRYAHGFAVRWQDSPAGEVAADKGQPQGNV